MSVFIESSSPFAGLGLVKAGPSRTLELALQNTGGSLPAAGPAGEMFKAGGAGPSTLLYVGLGAVALVGLGLYWKYG